MEKKNKKILLPLIIVFLGLILIIFGMILTITTDDRQSKNKENGNYQEEIRDINKEISLNKKIIYDDNIKIYLDKIHISNDKITIDVTIENNLNQDIVIYSNEIYIDNYLVSNEFYLEVAANTNKESEINIYDALVRIGNITNISILETSFIVESVEGNLITEPYLITTKISDTNNNILINGEELYNKDGIVIKYIKTESDFISNNLYFYIENNTEKDLLIYSDGIKLNDKDLMHNLNIEIKSNRKILSFLIVEFSEYDIEDKIESMQINLYFMDNNNYQIIENAVLNKK